MSTIEKLSIQGIRSFGSNAEDCQSISFASPVSLILGENGSGKTTVIECLKYALTGDTPPGSDKGKSFVHDPKIFGRTDTLGQIKLQVNNARGETLTVCRSMRLSTKKDKMTFETLDATINYGNDSISNRVADINETMSEFMGVSRPIINNVLLCHQEDSNWPLDESKKLKEKFDAIFGITEYNKAIDKLISVCKNLNAELKLKESDLHHLAYVKNEMEQKTLALQKNQKKHDDVQEQCDSLDKDIEPIDKRLAEIRDIEYEVAKHQSRRVELQTRQKNCSEQMQVLHGKIKNLFAGNIDELDEKISSFNATMKNKKTTQSKLADDLKRLKDQEKRIQSKQNDVEKRRCVLVQQRQNEQECVAKRAEKLKTLCVEMSIELQPDTRFEDVYLSTNAVKPELEKIENCLTDKKTEITNLQTQHEQEDHERQTAIDAIRADSTKLEEGKANFNKQRQDYEKEKRENKEKIGSIEESAKKLMQVNKEIENVTNCYEEMKTKIDQEKMRKQIDDSKVKIARLQEQFRKIDERLTFLNSISKLMSEITLKQNDHDKKEQEVRRVKSKHADNFGKVFSRTVESNFRRSLQVAYESLRREIKEFNEKINECRLKEQKLEIERKNCKDEIARMEKELEESKEKIFETCHGGCYEDLLAKCKETVNKFQLDHGALKSSEAMYKKYMRKIEEDPCCPLCHKDMSRNEALDVTAELSDEIHQLPDNISRTERLLKAEQKKYEGLLQLQPLIERVKQLERDLPKRKELFKSIQTKLGECSNENETMQLLLAEPTAKLDIANAMMGDMTLLDEAIKDVSRLKEDIEKLKNKLPHGCDTNESIEDLQLEKTIVSGELENERESLDVAQKDYEKATEGLNKLRELKTTLQEEQIKLQEGVQSLPQLKERRTELERLMENLNSELLAMQQKEQPLRQKLSRALSEKARCKEENRQTVAKQQTQLEKYKSLQQDIKRLHAEALEFEELQLQNKITQLQDEYKNLQIEYNKKLDEIHSMDKELEEIKTELLGQITIERELTDNRELKLLEKKANDLEHEFTIVANQLGELNFSKITREKNDLVKKRDQATVQKGSLLGQMGEIKNQIEKLQSELNKPEFKQSLANYCKANLEKLLCKGYIRDIEQYRKALEWALIEFHKEKMDQINALIREYWRLIYRGNDIDYIQILTDQGSSTNQTRRSYNYRVIQCKNNSEIEMRGRCSAGQRVLACLIIRMALAETFSTNCGILALDEPTTNLDKSNILSLCDALNRIVEDRKAQSNFMLVIITHDDDFISTLGRISTYHRVFRNDECKSVIRKVKLSDERGNF